jgi:hypothetical protein
MIAPRKERSDIKVGPTIHWRVIPGAFAEIRDEAMPPVVFSDLASEIDFRSQPS